MIEQAIKPMLATHKRLCQAESDELQLLVERFREDPESFWRGNKQPTLQWDKDRFFQAINNNDIAARADPNTASHMQRMMRNAALYQMAKDDPTAFNLKQIRQMCIRGIGFANPDQFLVMQQPATPPDPKAIAAQTSAQADLIDAQARQQKVQFDAQSNAERMKNDAADRQSKEKIAQDQLDRTQIIEAAKMRAQPILNFRSCRRMIRRTRPTWPISMPRWSLPPPLPALKARRVHENRSHRHERGPLAYPARGLLAQKPRIDALMLDFPHVAHVLVDREDHVARVAVVNGGAVAFFPYVCA